MMGGDEKCAAANCCFYATVVKFTIEHIAKHTRVDYIYLKCDTAQNCPAICGIYGF